MDIPGQRSRKQTYFHFFSSIYKIYRPATKNAGYKNMYLCILLILSGGYNINEAKISGIQAVKFDSDR